MATQDPQSEETYQQILFELTKAANTPSHDGKTFTMEAIAAHVNFPVELVCRVFHVKGHPPADWRTIAQYAQAVGATTEDLLRLAPVCGAVRPRRVTPASRLHGGQRGTRPFDSESNAGEDDRMLGRGLGRLIPTGPVRTPKRDLLPRPAVQDWRGHRLKPDPLGARTFAELEKLLREYWHWTGRRGTRKIAAGSGGAFSHATVAKLLHDKPQKPALKQDYVLGLILGCGGDEEEQQCWVTAWRRIDQATRAAAAPTETGQNAR